jgi:hypothetical protein
MALFSEIDGISLYMRVRWFRDREENFKLQK